MHTYRVQHYMYLQISTSTRMEVLGQVGKSACLIPHAHERRQLAAASEVGVAVIVWRQRPVATSWSAMHIMRALLGGSGLIRRDEKRRRELT